MDAPLASPAPAFTTLADRYEGARFNSPNDLVFKSNGDLYFTDPAYGMEKQWDDPRREMHTPACSAAAATERSRSSPRT